MIFTFKEVRIHPSGAGDQCRLHNRYLNIDKIVEVEQHDVQTTILRLDGENIMVASPVSRIIFAINSNDSNYLNVKFDRPAWKNYIKEKGWRE